MEGVIVNYKGGVHTQITNQMIVKVQDVDNKEKATELVGKTVIWESSAKKAIKGEVRAAHGCKGAIRVLFERGLPGQSISQKVKIE